MKRNYSKSTSILLITAIYLLAGIAAWLLFVKLTDIGTGALWALFAADVLATIVVWAFGLLYENVSVYDPYWSVFPPVVFLLWAIYTGNWSLPVILLLIASWYWGWRLTRNWVITFKGIAHEDWRYTKYRSLHPALFHLINFFGLNMVPTLVVFTAMLPGLQLYQPSVSASGLSAEGGLSSVSASGLSAEGGLSSLSVAVLLLGCLICLASATIQLIADKQSHDFRAANPGQVCNVGLWKRGRHPNYFGEIQFWWGIWIMYAAIYGFDWFILGPIAMTALFLGISIPLMEKRQLANKPAYADYRKQTRLLI